MGDERSSQSVALAVRNKVLPQALTLIRSSLLQGQALLVILCLLIILDWMVIWLENCESVVVTSHPTNWLRTVYIDFLFG